MHPPLNWPEIITAVASSATGIIVLVAQLMERRARNAHKAKLELIAAEAAAARTGVEAVTKQVSESRQERGKQMEEIKAAVAENTAISVQAFDVANGHNDKIRDLREDLNKVAQEKSL